MINLTTVLPGRITTISISSISSILIAGNSVLCSLSRYFTNRVFDLSNWSSVFEMSFPIASTRGML
jgi:hypothetical protein